MTNHKPLIRSSRTRSGRAPACKSSRRGVVSVLAMIFLVMFGSLCVAMAVASQGNLRTSATHLHMMRAMSAAETGMKVAQGRLMDAAARFVVGKGRVDATFGSRLWLGTFTSGDGPVTVLSARNGRFDATRTAGIADAVLNSHLTDLNIVQATGFPTQAQLFSATTEDPAVFATEGWVRTPLIAIDADATAAATYPAAYQITYAPLVNGTDVRIMVTGFSAIGTDGTSYAWGATSADSTARPVTRVIQQDFRISKRPGHAMLSPSRIMIGKNVVVNGNLGARYTDVAQQYGDPIETKSDFKNLNATLDAKLARFYQAVRQYDVDGDNRLRAAHAVESQGLPGTAELTANSWSSDAFADSTRDGYVDDCDLFINHYDANKDGNVVLSAALTAGTPAAALAAEFTGDDDLGLLIDSALPDRNRNGVYGFLNAADNTKVTPSSATLDADDRVLGWRDGVVNYKDQYAKVRGQMLFKAQAADWAAARGGSYRALLEGPFAPGSGKSANKFGASDSELPPVDASSFSDSETPLQQSASGQTFDQQVASQLGVSTTQLATYVEPGTNPNAPQYWRSDLNDSAVYTATGQHLYEKMPFNAPTYTDYYYRPRYVNMKFKNVQIPQGCNGLFVNCTFAGVTYVRSYQDNSHTNWSLYGQMTWDSSQSKPSFTTAPLDKSDFLRYTTGSIADGPSNYASFPDPPVINGATKTGAERNTKLYSNNIRFHNCLFVGSIVGDTPQAYTNVRNKLQFTGSTRFTNVHPDQPTNSAVNPDPGQMEVIETSSMMLPNYSVDIGSFNAPTDTFSGGPASQNVQLRGTVVAGVLDVRGNTYIDGALFMTFAPTAGEGPLQQFGQPVGNPANFNCTLGYFGPTDGDGEAVDPNTLPLVGGQRIVGYDTDGDGLPDVDSSQTQPAGSTPIPFYGYGRITLNWNPNLPMPDGIMLPVSAVAVDMSYREGKQQ